MVQKSGMHGARDDTNAASRTEYVFHFSRNMPWREKDRLFFFQPQGSFGFMPLWI